MAPGVGRSYSQGFALYEVVCGADGADAIRTSGPHRGILQAGNTAVCLCVFVTALLEPACARRGKQQCVTLPLNLFCQQEAGWRISVQSMQPALFFWQTLCSLWHPPFGPQGCLVVGL